MEQRIIELLHNLIIDGNLDEIDEEDLEDWKNSSDHNKRIYDDVTSEVIRDDFKKIFDDEDSSRVWAKVEDKLRARPEPVIIRHFKARSLLRYAAASIIFVSLGAFLLFSGFRSQPKAFADIPVSVIYTTLSTVKGQKVQELLLADGSRVWLNAASSIRYPASFDGRERRVELTGEAYFEVAKDAAKPFIVAIRSSDKRLDRGEIRVLGTHFNVKAYDDEAVVKSTLLEGSIRFTNKNNTVTLKPGQQVNARMDATPDVVDNINTDAIMGWKNEMISFTSTDIRTVMREVQRYYDVEVNYSGNISDEKFTLPALSRDQPISTLLKVVEEMDVAHFNINGKQITVTP